MTEMIQKRKTVGSQTSVDRIGESTLSVNTGYFSYKHKMIQREYLDHRQSFERSIAGTSITFLS